MPENWWDADPDEDSWGQDDEEIGAASTPKPPRTQRPLSWWERFQQGTSGFAYDLAQGAKGLVKETPLMLARQAKFLPEDLASGAINLAADATGLSRNPKIASALIRQDEERNKERQRIEQMLGEGRDAGTGEKVGRTLARAVPGIATGIATGGASVPVQMAVQGGQQAIQSLSEGASPTAAAFSGGLASAGAPIAAGISALKAPFKSYVNKGAQEAAKRLNIELPAGAMTESPLARGLEQAASRAWGGGSIEKKGLSALEDVQAGARGMAQGADDSVAGQMIGEDYGARRAALQAAKNAEYAKVGDLKGIPAVPEGTIAEIDRLLEQGTLDPDTLANLQRLRRAISPQSPEVAEGAVDLGEKYAGDTAMERLVRAQLGKEAEGAAQPRSVADLMSQQAGIEYGGPNALRDAALGNRLRGGLKADIDTTLQAADPAKAAQLAKAKEAYGRYADLSESELGKVASKNVDKGTESVITNRLLRPGASREDLKRLMDVARPETKDQVRLSYIQKIVGRIKDMTPKQIDLALEKAKNADVILTPEQIQRLRDLSTVSKAMSMTRIGSPTEPLQQARKYLTTPARAGTLAAAAALGGPVGPLAAFSAGVVGESAMAKWLSSPSGQKWLLEGFAPGMAEQLTRGGATAASRVIPEYEMQERRRRLDALLKER